MKIRVMVFLLSILAACVVVFFVFEENRHPILFWPGNMVGKRLSDFAVDAERQRSLLLAADPVRDAEQAFERGDWRLIGNRLSRMMYFGTPDVPLEPFTSRFGSKTIAVTEALLEDKVFIEAKNRYESNYNAKLYSLIMSELKAGK